MDAAVWGVVGVVVGGLITGIVTLRAEGIRADKAAALDSAKRQNDRQIDADRFQQETLLSLQESIAKFIRAEGKGHHADVMALRSTGDLTLYPEGLSDEMFETNRQLSYLVERVKDDKLRELVGALRSRAAESAAWRATAHGSLTEAELDADMMATGERANAANSRLGIVLRDLL